MSGKRPVLRRRPNVRRCTTAGTSEAAGVATLSRRDRRPLHLRRSARRHRDAPSAGPARRPSRPTSTRSRRRSTTPTTTRSSRGSTTPATSPPSRRSSPSTTSGSSCPLTDLDQSIARRAPRRARAGARPRAPRPRCAAAMGDKYLAHVFFEEHGIPSPRTLAPRATCRTTRATPLLVKVREGFGSRHIYRADDRRAARVLSSAHTPGRLDGAGVCVGEEFSIDVFCDLEGRCLNAIPRTMIQSKGGESIKGTSIRDRELIEHGAARRGDDRDRRAGERPVLPRARRLASPSPTSTRASAAPSRCRSPPAAATRSSRSRSRAASGRSRGSATSARAS